MPEDIAMQLDKLLSKFGWFLSVNAGKRGQDDVLIVYVRSNEAPQNGKLDCRWQGIDVIVRAIGVADGKQSRDDQKAAA